MTDVRVERVGHVDLFTPIDPPDVRRALRFQSYDALELAVREMTARCLVITGANRRSAAAVMCAGVMGDGGARRAK